MQTQKSYLETFVESHKFEIECPKNANATHLNMLGGCYRIAPSLEPAFLYSYSQDVESGSKHHCLTEVVTDVFPFFVDLDVHDPGVAAAPKDSDQEIIQWATACVRAVARCCLPVDTQYDGEGEEDEQQQQQKSRVARVQAAALHFNMVMGQTEAVVMSAPPRLTVKGVSGLKRGVHIIWPCLLVTKPLAKQLREVVVIALYERCPGRQWSDIVDLTVYRKMSSLRMFGSYKHTSCPDCDVELLKMHNRAKRQLRGQLAVLMGLSEEDDSTSKRIELIQHFKKKSVGEKLTEEEAKQKAKLDEYLAVARLLTCTTCHQRRRVPDVAASVYSVLTVLNPVDGEKEAAVQELHGDQALTAHICSVRRHNCQPCALKLPDLPALVKLQPVTVEGDQAADYSSDTERVQQEVQVYTSFTEPSLSRAFSKEPIENSEALDLVQRYIRGGALGHEYRDVQIAQLYRLYSDKPTTLNADGCPPHAVVATTRGYGARYCNGVQREHTTNHVRFEFREDRTCVQKCFSGKSAACKKPCRAVVMDVPAAVYTAIFPFSPKTLLVLPEERLMWTSGQTTDDWLRQLLKRVKPDMPVKSGRFSRRSDAYFVQATQTARRMLAARAKAARVAAGGGHSPIQVVADSEQQQQEQQDVHAEYNESDLYL